MEAVPRMPMICFELKLSPDHAEFGLTLRQYISEKYGESPSSYNDAISELESLRSSAVKVSQDFMGCSLLKKYYCQCFLLQNRFPLHDVDPYTITFTWDDVFTNKTQCHDDISFELASILYNIGALHSILGSMDTRQSAEGMKISCTHFQCAAWAFQNLQDNFSSTYSYHLDHNILTFQINLMLAQAQECILEKSMTDNRKSTITAKVASQIVEYYRLAQQSLESQLGQHKKFKEWKKRMEIKSLFYQCVTMFYLGNQAEEQQKWGERLTYYKESLTKLEACNKLVKNDDEVAEALRFTMDVVGGKHNIAERENGMVYHEKVPTIESLPEIKGASLVKGIPFDPNDLEISGPDIFGKLVPMEAHASSSLYSEEKAKLLRQIGSDIEQKEEELAQFLSALKLDVNMLSFEPMKLPEELLEICAAISVKPDAMKNLITAMQNLSGISLDVNCNIKDIQHLIHQEELNEKEFQEIYGKMRPPNIIISEIAKECAKYEEGLMKAGQSNADLHKAMNEHVTNLRLLSGSLNELQAAIPSLESLKSDEDAALVNRLRHILCKVDEMRKQRTMLADSIRKQIHDDDITQQLVGKESESVEETFKRHLGKHDAQRGFLNQNLSAQANILHALTDANAEYAKLRKATGDTLQKREAKIQNLIQSYEVYEDLLAKSQKGIEFYKKLESNVTKLLQRLQGVLKVQDEERQQILEKLLPKSAPPPRPLAPKPGSHIYMELPFKDPNMLPDTNTDFESNLDSDSSIQGPTLKDFLPFMKPKTFGNLRKTSNINTNQNDEAQENPAVSSQMGYSALQQPNNFSQNQNIYQSQNSTAHYNRTMLPQHVTIGSLDLHNNAGNMELNTTDLTSISQQQVVSSQRNRNDSAKTVDSVHTPIASPGDSVPPYLPIVSACNPGFESRQNGNPSQYSHSQQGMSVKNAQVPGMQNITDTSQSKWPSQNGFQGTMPQYQPSFQSQIPQNTFQPQVDNSSYAPNPAINHPPQNTVTHPVNMSAMSMPNSRSQTPPSQSIGHNYLPGQYNQMSHAMSQPCNAGYQDSNQIRSNQGQNLSNQNTCSSRPQITPPGQNFNPQLQQGYPQRPPAAAFTPTQSLQAQNINQQSSMVSNAANQGYVYPTGQQQFPSVSLQGQSNLVPINQNIASYAYANYQGQKQHEGATLQNIPGYSANQQPCSVPHMNPGLNDQNQQAAIHGYAANQHPSPLPQSNLMRYSQAQQYPGYQTATPRLPNSQPLQAPSNPQPSSDVTKTYATQQIPHSQQTMHTAPSRPLTHHNKEQQIPFQPAQSFLNQSSINSPVPSQIANQYTQYGYTQTTTEKASFSQSKQIPNTVASQMTNVYLNQPYNVAKSQFQHQQNNLTSQFSSSQYIMGSPGYVSQPSNVNENTVVPGMSSQPQNPAMVTAVTHNTVYQQPSQYVPDTLNNFVQNQQLNNTLPPYVPPNMLNKMIPVRPGMTAPSTPHVSQQYVISNNRLPAPNTHTNNYYPSVEQTASCHGTLLQAGQSPLNQHALPVEQQHQIGPVSVQPPTGYNIGPNPSSSSVISIKSAPSSFQTCIPAPVNQATPPLLSPSVEINRQNSTSSMTDDLLSTSPDLTGSANGATVLTPKVLTEEDIKREKEEQLRNTICSQTSDPLADNLLLDKFVWEVELFRKNVLNLMQRFENGLCELDTIWKELNDDMEVDSKKRSMAIAKCYTMKNRKPDILPYDDSRVVLTTQKDDYINASNVDSLAASCPKFIATQSPLPVTYVDFWWMACEQGSEIIVMLLDDRETNKAKPHIYWPTEKGKQISHGPIQLTLQSIKEKDHWIQRLITLTNKETKTSRTLFHLQFTNWTACTSVISACNPVIEFISEVHSLYKQQRNLIRPVIVHCSAGVKQTAVFCVLYTAVQEINMGNGIINIPDTVRHLRQKRKYMLQDKEQLRFCYEAVSYYAQDVLVRRGVVRKPSIEKKQDKSHKSSDDVVLGELCSFKDIQSTVAKLHVREKSEVVSDPNDSKLDNNADQNGHADLVHAGLNTDCKPDIVDTEEHTVSPIYQGHRSRSNSGSSVISSVSLGSQKNVSSKSNSPIHAVTSSLQNLPTSLADVQNPDMFTIGLSSSPQRITKSTFSNPTRHLAGKQNPDDPLDQLDPLWSIK